MVAKDAMLSSWAGLKSQALKNYTRHLYDSIKDFQILLKEIRKVDQEESSIKTTKQQAGFCSDVIECPPVTQTARVRSPVAA